MRVLDLGDVLLEVDGSTGRPGGRRASALLCLLTLNLNRRVSVDSLVDAVWGEGSGDQSASTLDTLVWRLRRVLEPHREARQPARTLVNDAAGYRLLLNEDQVDSRRFEMLVDESRQLLIAGEPDRALRRAEDALRLWRGRPYGIHADEEWAMAAAGRLEELLAEVKERRIDALLATGDAVRAAADAGTLVHELPLREGLWARLMLACYRAGRVDEALQHFQRARRVLRDEVGTEPGRELQELQRRILAADPELAPRPPQEPPGAPPITLATSADTVAPGPEKTTEPSPQSHLPRWMTPLIGRDTELRQLAGLVRSTALTTVVGTAGCGKTRLSVAAAESLAPAFPDGVWFVDLSVVDDPELVLGVTMSAVGLGAAQPGSAVEQLRAHLRNRRLLMVLDNCEHVLPTVRDLVRMLIAPDAEFTLLATSREPLDLDGEVVWTLPPLPVRRDDVLDTYGADGPGQNLESDGNEAPASPAAELFLTRLRQVAPNQVVDATAMHTVERICAAADGIPLAIELGAARARSSTLVEIAAQMVADPAGIARPGPHHAGSRHTVGAAIETSYRLLSEDEQTAHRRLAVLPGMFTADAAAAVIGSRDQMPPTSDLLADLVHRSLLTFQPSQRPEDPSRYAQLATIRAHAHRALEASGEARSAVERRDQWVLTLMGQRPALARADHDGWYGRANQAFDVIRASLQRHLIDQPSPLGPRIVAGLGNIWIFQGRVMESSRWLAPALSAVDLATADGVLIGATYATVLTSLGRLDLARSVVDQCVAYNSRPGHADEDAVTALSFGALAGITYREADLALIQAAAVIRLSRNSPGNPTIKQLGAVIECLVDVINQTPPEPGRPTLLYREAKAAGNLLGAWIASAVHFFIAAAEQDVRSALTWLDRVIDIAVTVGVRSIWQWIEGRADAVFATGEFTQAVVHHAWARSEARRAGMPWPALPETTGILDQARTALGSQLFDQAWRYGSTLQTDDPRTASLESE